jgi:CRP-like cAMP-binding protein
MDGDRLLLYFRQVISSESSAVALDDTELLLIPKEDFEKMMQEDCELALCIVKKIAIAMSKNLRRMNDKFLSALISY